MEVNQIIERSKKIRAAYRLLEQQHHGSEWTVEEDPLAFLTDAGLVGRHTMPQQERQPAKNNDIELNTNWLYLVADDFS